MWNPAPFSDKIYQPLGVESARIIASADKHRAHHYAPYPFVVSAAKGPWLYDPDGNKALDFLACYSAVISHRHPKIIRAVIRELENGCDAVSNMLYTTAGKDFVNMISALTGYDRVLPKCDGASVTSTAIKGLCKHAAQHGIKNPEVILTRDYFHGRGIEFALAAKFDPSQNLGSITPWPGLVVVPHTPKAIETAITENTIGIFFEVHKGEGGPIFGTKETYLEIMRIARNYDLFIGTDEIQTGLGRCGHMFSWNEYGYGKEVRPDFVTIGKSLGGGIIPVSALIGTEEFMSVFTPGTEGSTYGGYPIGCAAACASLRVILEEGIFEKALKLGDLFVRRVNAIPGISAEGRGALIRVDVHNAEGTEGICKEMLLGEREPRVFMKHGHGSFIRVSPPIGAYTEELMEEALEQTIVPVLTESAELRSRFRAVYNFKF